MEVASELPGPHAQTILLAFVVLVEALTSWAEGNGEFYALLADAAPVTAATVIAGDCEFRSFRFPLWLWLPLKIYAGLMRPKRVNILGQELAGEIESVGQDVKRFSQGDQVFAATDIGMGAYAEYKCMREDKVLSIRSLTQHGRHILANPRPSQMVRAPWTSRISSKKVIFEFPPYRAEDLFFLKELIPAGKIKSVIDRRYSLEQIVEAHRYVDNGHKTGHVVITL